MTAKQKFNIVIPADMKPRPKIHEETAAAILANHFAKDVYFIEVTNHGTPDIRIDGVEWEMKSPDGASQYTIQNNMRKAGRQSKNIIVDLRRVRLHHKRALGYINKFMSGASSKFNRVLVITKSGKVLVIK